MPDDRAPGVPLSAREKRLRFRELLGRRSCTVMPGGFSPVYARLAEMAGFECFFVAGSQMSAFLLGVPDNGILGLRDVVDHARHVAARTDIPILLDTDTGFGNAVNVHYAVQECVDAGVAGLQIEDQEAPKKSGTSAGRRCISIDEAVGKYRAAVAARDELDSEFVICARCDALGAEGGGFEQALERCIAYVRDGGADLVWLNSVESREQLQRACALAPAPVLTIWGGPPPAPGVEEYEKLGLRIALYPVVAATAGMQAAWHVMNDLKARGSVALEDWAARVKASPWGAVELNKVVKAAQVRELEQRCLPAGAQRDYASTWGHETHLGYEGGVPPSEPPKAARD
jgi:2-methylisocitrate lyase-like PEP mutase family enzyme